MRFPPRGLTIDEPLWQRVQQYAGTWNIPVSTAVRHLLRSALDGTSQPPPRGPEFEEVA